MRAIGPAVSAALIGGLVLAGCGTEPGESTSPAPADASATTASEVTPTSPPEFATANCPGRLSGSGTVDSMPPTSRRQAAAWPQTPYEAARNTQTAPAFRAVLGDGELVEVASARGGTTYVVVEDDRAVGRLTVRPVGFGAFATSEIETCSPAD